MKATISAGNPESARPISDFVGHRTKKPGIVKTEKGRSFILDPSDYLAKRGVPAALKTEVLCLSGDSADNIPGIRRRGEKTAVRLIQKFGSVKGVYQNLDKVQTEKLRALLDSAEAHEALKLIRALIQLNENLPIDDAIFQTGTQRTENLQEFFLTLDMVKTAEGLGLSPALPFVIIKHPWSHDACIPAPFERCGHGQLPCPCQLGRYRRFAS
jgi:DNA polymerase-1